MAATSSVSPSHSALAGRGNSPQQEEHQPANRAHVGRQRATAVDHLQPFQEVVERHARIDEPTRIVPGDNLLFALGAVFVVDLANQFFQHVFHRHQALGAAEFVQHDRHLRPLLSETLQQFGDPQRLGYQQRGADQLPQFDRPAHVLPQEKVLGVDEADDVVQVAFVDRQPREAGHGHGADDLVGGRIDVQRVDFDARPHDLAHRAVAQP